MASSPLSMGKARSGDVLWRVKTFRMAGVGLCGTEAKVGLLVSNGVVAAVYGESEKRSCESALWSVACEVWSGECAVRSVQCGVWSVKWRAWRVKCGVWSVKCDFWSVTCEAWSVECEMWRVEWRVESVKCEVWSVKSGVWSVKCGVGWRVWSVKCGVWSVESEVQCSTGKYWGALCASFVIQSGTGNYPVQALWYKVLGSALCKLCNTK